MLIFITLLSVHMLKSSLLNFRKWRINVCGSWKVAPLHELSFVSHLRQRLILVDDILI